jgi:hypothetical protein
MAGGGACRPAAFKRLARTLSGRGDDLLADEYPVGNVKNNDPSLIEPWRSPLTKGFRANWRLFDLG